MAKAGGRPRKNGDRHPCGKRRQAPEPAVPAAVIDKRRALVGGYTHPRHDRKVDPAKDSEAGYPLGILYLRGMIFEADHQAGLTYAALHAAVWGCRTAKSHLGDLLRGMKPAPDADDAERRKREREVADRLAGAEEVLHKLGSAQPWHVLQNVVVHERAMRFMDPARATSPAAWLADETDLDALRLALDALARHWRIARAARAG